MADQIAGTEPPKLASPVLQDIYTDPLLRDYFQKFCVQEYSTENLYFLLAAESIRDSYDPKDPTKSIAKLKKLNDEYIVTGAPNEINLKANNRNSFIQQLEAGKIELCIELLHPTLEPKNDVFKEARPTGLVREIDGLIEKDTFVRFLSGPLGEQYRQIKEALAKREQEIAAALAKVAENKDPVTKAMVIRGHSFISAAQLIAANSVTEMDAIAPEAFPLRKMMQDKFPQYLKQFPNQSNSALMQDYLQMLDRHWLTAVNRTEPAEVTKKDLAALEKELVTLVKANVYAGKPEFSQVKNELDNAENHVCWKARSIQSCGVDDGIVGERAETPIARLTTAQTKEWESILNPAAEQPKWFTVLPAWEQQHLQARVKAWQQQDKNNPNYKENLGEFLGSVPTTIRRYPGAANAYKTKYEVIGKDGKIHTFNKVRAGYLVPFDVKDRKEKARIAQQNIEQLLVESIADHIAAERVRLGIKEPDPITINMPFLVQTLQTAPVQPAHGLFGAIVEMCNFGNNAALFKAIDKVRARLDENPAEYLQELGAKIPTGVTIEKIEVVAANRPVNAFRGFAGAAGFLGHAVRAISTVGFGLVPALDKYISKIPLIGNLGRRYRENANTTEVLQTHLQRKLAENPDDPGLQMAKAAMESYRSQTSFFSSWQAPFNCISSWINNSLLNLKNVLFARAGHGANYNSKAEQAALEQIIAGKIGCRIGTCVSGKDREEMVTTIALAMTEFYAKHGKMPPQGNCLTKANRALRKEFVESVAKHFHSGQGQELAGANAAGCDGLKNVTDVLCKDICDAIRRQEKVKGLKGNSIKITNVIAGANKLGKGSVQNANEALREGLSVTTVMGAAREVIAVTPATQPKVTKDVDDADKRGLLAGKEHTVTPGQNAKLTDEQKEDLKERAGRPAARSVVGDIEKVAPAFIGQELTTPAIEEDRNSRRNTRPTLGGPGA